MSRARALLRAPLPAGEDVGRRRRCCCCTAPAATSRICCRSLADLMPDAGVLSPRGKVLEHGMPRFFRRLAEGVFDLEDLRVRTAELADFVTAAAQALRVRCRARDRRRLFERREHRGEPGPAAPGRAAPARSCSARWCRSCPTRCRRCRRTPVLVSNGRADPIVAAAETERLAALLRDAGAEVTLAWQAAGHHLVQEDLIRAREWLGSPGRSTQGER